MNLGLGNLNELKRHLLAVTMQGQTTYDITIAMIGRGIAAQFGRHCNRRFERTVDAQAEFTADRDHYYLPCYPVETITSIEQRDNMTDGWKPLSIDVILNRGDESGLISFGPGASLGYWSSRIRVTYTGGYWFETLEPGETGYPTAQPAGSTVLPADLRLAWLLQCGRVWELMDKLGTNIDPEQAASKSLADLELLPEVKQVLEVHRRLMLS